MAKESVLKSMLFDRAKEKWSSKRVGSLLSFLAGVGFSVVSLAAKDETITQTSKELAMFLLGSGTLSGVATMFDKPIVQKVVNAVTNSLADGAFEKMAADTFIGIQAGQTLTYEDSKSVVVIEKAEASPVYPYGYVKIKFPNGETLTLSTPEEILKLK